MLNVPTSLLPEFYAFVQAYFGVAPRVHEKPKRGEYARFRLGSAFVFVRDHDDLSRDAATVEVFSADTKTVEEIERAWLPYLKSKLSENENDNPTGNETSGSVGCDLPESGNG